MIVIVKTLLVALLLLAVGACSTEQNTVAQGPEGSWWLGGADGGVFVDIKDDNNRNDTIYYGTIYFDSDKTIWYQGPFKLVGNIKFQVDNHEQYSGWDGERLHLQNSSYLDPLNPIPSL